MEELTQILDRHGVWLLFAVGFLEYAGAPIASVPILVVAGALAAMGDFPIAAVVAAAAAGALLADIGWYTAARWRGARLVSTVCGLSSNPDACVVGVERKLRAVKSLYLIPAKFLPATGNLVAAASGFSRMSLVEFIAIDAAGVVIWAAVYGGIGWLLAPQVEHLLGVVSSFGWWIAVVAVVLVAVGAARRLRKVRRHRVQHASPLTTPSVATRLVPSE